MRPCLRALDGADGSVLRGEGGYGKEIGLGKLRKLLRGLVQLPRDCASNTHPLQTITSRLIHEREPLSLIPEHEAPVVNVISGIFAHVRRTRGLPVLDMPTRMHLCVQC